MNQREIASITALKNVFDAYHELPLSVRAEIDEKMNPALGMVKSAIDMYKAETRAIINTTILRTGMMNHRWNATEVEFE